MLVLSGKNHSSAFDVARSVDKYEVLPVNNKSLYTVLCTIIAGIQSAIPQVGYFHCSFR